MDPLHLGDSREGLGTAVKLNRGGCPSMSFNPSGPSPSLLVSLPSIRPASFASVSGMLVTGDSSLLTGSKTHAQTEMRLLPQYPNLVGSCLSGQRWEVWAQRRGACSPFPSLIQFPALSRSFLLRLSATARKCGKVTVCSLNPLPPPLLGLLLPLHSALQSSLGSSHLVSRSPSFML